MTQTALWLILVSCGALLGLRAWVTARRIERARHGQRRFLRHRGRVLRVYHRLRDKRICDPTSHPETSSARVASAAGRRQFLRVVVDQHAR